MNRPKWHVATASIRRNVSQFRLHQMLAVASIVFACVAIWATSFKVSRAMAATVTVPTFVQERDTQVNSGTTNSVSFVKPTVAGNLIVAYLIWDNTGTVTVSDSLNNIYSSAGAATRWSSGKYSSQIFYAVNLFGGANTVKATFSTRVSQFGIVYAHEYAGISQSAPLDVTVAATGSSGSLNSGAATTTTAPELLFAGGVSANNVTSPGSGYAARSMAHGNITEDRIASTAGSYGAMAANSAGAAWGIQMVAFKGASSSTGTGGSGTGTTPPPPPPDTNPPTVPAGLTAIAASPSQVNLAWNPSTDTGAASSALTYSVNRNGAHMATTPAGTTSWADGGVAPSTTYAYSVSATDPSGNTSQASAPVTVTTPATPDTQPPSVNIAAPVQNQTISGTTTILANANDNVGVVSVQFQLDGGSLGAAVTAAPYSYSWNTNQASNGAHTVTAVASDAAGNKTVSTGVAIIVNNASVQSYSTNFPRTENPISESGEWINGGTTGVDWGNVETTSGLAFGTTVSGAPPYNDSTAILSGSWASDQMAQATVHTANQTGAAEEEVELRLRTTIAPNNITGYEFDYRALAGGGQYIVIVRWNGPLNSFTYLTPIPCTTCGPGLRDGDTVMATAVGNTLTLYINGTQYLQAVDATYAGGSPGIGFYNNGGTVANNSDFGFTSFTASNITTNGTVAPPTPTNLAATVVSPSQIQLNWSPSTDTAGVTGYQVFRNGVQIATSATTGFPDTTVVPGVQYSYAVAAVDAAGNVSAQSAPVLAETSVAADTSGPSIPANLQSTNIGATSLTLSWSASTDNVAVAGYQVFRNGNEVGTTSTTSYTDTGLTASTPYVYTVAAYDSSNNFSIQSQTLSVSTVAAATVAPTFIQVNNNQISQGASVAAPFNRPTQAGNTIVAYVIWSNATGVALSDSDGNTFVNVGLPVSWGNGYSAQVFYASGIAGGADTVTATFRTSVTSFGVIYVHEYAGINSANPVDATTSASGSSAAMNSGSVTTTGANDLIFGAGVSDKNVSAPGTGFSLRDLAYGNITEDQVANAAGSYAATATHNGKMWGMQVVAFRAAQ